VFCFLYYFGLGLCLGKYVMNGVITEVASDVRQKRADAPDRRSHKGGVTNSNNVLQAYRGYHNQAKVHESKIKSFEADKEELKLNNKTLF